MSAGFPPNQPPPYPHVNPADLATMGVLTLKDILGTTVRAMADNALAFLVLAFAFTTPGQVIALLMQLSHDPIADAIAARGRDPFDRVTANLAANFGIVLLQSAANFLAQGAVIYATVEFMAGRKVPVGMAVQRSLSTILPCLGTALLMTIVTTIGFFMCLVPGVILSLVFYLSVPVAVCERLGPINAMGRSAHLTNGHKGTIFLALLVFVLAYIPFACLIGGGAAGGVAASLSGAADHRVVTLLLWAINWGLTVVLTVALAALASVFYARIRGIREGMDIQSLAQVFA